MRFTCRSMWQSPDWHVWFTCTHAPVAYIWLRTCEPLRYVIHMWFKCMQAHVEYMWIPWLTYAVCMFWITQKRRKTKRLHMAIGCDTWFACVRHLYGWHRSFTCSSHEKFAHVGHMYATPCGVNGVVYIWSTWLKYAIHMFCTLIT